MFALILLAATTAAPPADLTLVGVVVGRRPESSVAILRAGGRTRIASVGEAAFGGRVRAVAAAGVTVEFGSEPVELRLPQAAFAGLTAPAPAARADAVSGGRVLERREVERRLGEEASRILAETTLVPAMDGARVAGFTLARIPEGTLLTDAGLQPGDILTSVNDTPVDSLATLIALWPRLQGETSLRATVLRNGQPLTLSVDLR
jgi:general secretion pathway protein C